MTLNPTKMFERKLSVFHLKKFLDLVSCDPPIRTVIAGIISRGDKSFEKQT
jgi:hypothetical protein